VRDLMLESNSTARKLVDCCRPDRMFRNEGDFILFWKEIKEAVGASPVANPHAAFSLPSSNFST
jgi:hypothetical protein